MSINWGAYADAYKAIYDAIISQLMSPLEGKKVTRLEFTYNADKDIQTIVFKQVAETLFTLTFTYNADKDVESITRS